MAKTPTFKQLALPGSIWEVVNPIDVYEKPWQTTGGGVGNVQLKVGQHIQLLEAFMHFFNSADDWFHVAPDGDSRKSVYLKNSSLKDDTKLISTLNRTAVTKYAEADPQLRTKAQVGSKWTLKYDIPVYVPTPATKPNWNNDWAIHTHIKANDEIEVVSTISTAAVQMGKWLSGNGQQWIDLKTSTGEVWTVRFSDFNHGPTPTTVVNLETLLSVVPTATAVVTKDVEPKEALSLDLPDNMF